MNHKLISSPSSNNCAIGLNQNIKQRKSTVQEHQHKNPIMGTASLADGENSTRQRGIWPLRSKCKFLCVRPAGDNPVPMQRCAHWRRRPNLQTSREENDTGVWLCHRTHDSETQRAPCSHATRCEGVRHRLHNPVCEQGLAVRRAAAAAYLAFRLRDDGYCVWCVARSRRIQI